MSCKCELKFIDVKEEKLYNIHDGKNMNEDIETYIGTVQQSNASICTKINKYQSHTQLTICNVYPYLFYSSLLYFCSEGRVDGATAQI